MAASIFIKFFFLNLTSVVQILLTSYSSVNPLCLFIALLTFLEVASEFFVGFARLVSQSVVFVANRFEVEINAADPALIWLFDRSLAPRQVR